MMSIPRFVRRYSPANSFARNVSILAAGTVSGHLIVIASAPLLTRLYSPDDFGVLAVFTALLTIIGVVASLRYQLAILLPERDDEAVSVVVLSIVAVLVMALLTILLVVSFGEEIAVVTNTTSLSTHLWLLPIGVAFVGVYQVLNYCMIRTKGFTVIARTRPVQDIGMIMVQVGGSMFGPVALLLGNVVSQAVGIMTLSSRLRSTHGYLLRNLTVSDVWRMALRYRHFPLYSSWSGLLNTGGSQLPPVIFAVMYGGSAAGLYMLAHRMLTLPFGMLGGAVADVFLTNTVESLRRDRLAELVTLLHAKLTQISVPLSVLVFVASPGLFPLAFGAEWEEAGYVARWLAPMLFFQFIVSPLSRVFIVLERSRLGLILQANLFAARLGGLGVAYLFSVELADAVKFYCVASIAGYLAYIVVIASLTGNQMSSFIVDWLKVFSIALATSSPLLFGMLLGWQGPMADMTLAIASALCVGLYWSVLSAKLGQRCTR